jgi:predicted enzyme related to lactoylglutathione lyase
MYTPVFRVRPNGQRDEQTHRSPRKEQVVLENSKAYSGFAVDDIEKAKGFYGETLGLKTTQVSEEEGLISLELAGDRPTLIYHKPDFTPATYTILNFPVDDIEKAVDELAGRGVTFEQYDAFEQDEKGIAHAGPLVAWFKDPAGNILSVIQDD